MKSERPLLLGIANVFLEMVSRVGALTDIEIPSFVPFGKLLQYNAQDDCSHCPGLFGCDASSYNCHLRSSL